MERQFVTKNNRERERLRKLVNEITDEELNLVIYKEGWTVAVVFAHLAFWDERRRRLVLKWKKEGVKAEPGISTDIINDTLLPLLLGIPPRKAAELAVLTANALDNELGELPAEMITAIELLEVPHALDRSIHRKMHLDEIEAFLTARRSRK